MPEGSEWLPRQCPGCGQVAVIGHGRRRRQAHGSEQSWIRVRRGICKQCGRSVTVLPAGLLPYGHYTVDTRQQALAALEEGAPLEQAAPPCRDPNRLPDPATLRRWVYRRLESLWCCLARAPAIFRRPTILAWDWRAAARILMLEPSPA